MDAKIDNNYKKTLTAVTDDANATITRLLVDPSTGRLKVSGIVVSSGGTAVTSLNGITTPIQLLAVGNSGNQFNISSAGSTHTFNLPTASATGTGQLTAQDWLMFNSKGSVVNYTLPLSIGGTTVSISKATSSGSGYLSGEDWVLFNSKGSVLGFVSPLSLSGTIISIPKATSSGSGYLSGEDWTIFQSKGSVLSYIQPLSVSGTIVSMGTASATGSGYLTIANFNTFNGKADYSFGANNFLGQGNFTTSGGGSVKSLAVGTIVSTGSVRIDDILTAQGTITAQQGVQFQTTAYYDAEFNNGNSGASITVSWDNGNKQLVTVTATGSIYMIAPAGPANLLLRLTQNASSGSLITWSPAVKWSGGSILSSGSSATDIASFFWNGTNYYGMISNNFI